MIRWRHYTERILGGYAGASCTKHTLAFRLGARYLIITWTWTR